MTEMRFCFCLHPQSTGDVEGCFRLDLPCRTARCPLQNVMYKHSMRVLFFPCTLFNSNINPRLSPPKCKYTETTLKTPSASIELLFKKTIPNLILLIASHLSASYRTGTLMHFSTSPSASPGFMFLTAVMNHPVDVFHIDISPRWAHPGWSPWSGQRHQADQAHGLVLCLAPVTFAELMHAGN